MYLCVMRILLCHHSFLGYLECSIYIVDDVIILT